MNTLLHTRFPLILLTVLLAGAVLLSACAPAALGQLPEPTAPSVPPAATAAAPTAEPALPYPAAETKLVYTLNSADLASSLQAETVDAKSAADGAPYWEVMPAYTRLTLEGYPVAKHVMQARIFIYPVADLGKANETAGKVAASLRELLQSQQEPKEYPILPLEGESQILHPQFQYLDFQSGQGLRYLTQLGNGIVPVNNRALVYTYQGLTSDGKYYVAALLPVTHASLPADEMVTGKEPPEFTSDYPKYLANEASRLNQEAPGSFTPDLAKLDAMLKSLEVH